MTEIEHWLRDPYTIYAKHILDLRPLDAVDTPPGARDRGTVIHGAIGDFTEKYAKALPADPLDALLELGEEKFRAAAGLSGGARVLVAALPAHRALVRLVGRAAARERDRAACRDQGRPEIQIDKWIFKLTTQADRIEQLADGSYAILDYKTGATPTEPQVAHRTVAAADARRRDPARGRVQGRARPDRSARSPMCRCADASPRARRSRSRSRKARRTSRPTRRWHG